MRRTSAFLLLLLPLLAQAEVPIPTYPQCGEPDRDDLCPSDLGGEWNLISYIPAGARGAIRPAEAELGSGMWADRAWRISTGRFDVLVAIADSGIDWREGSIVNKLYLHAPELPFPQGTDGLDRGSHDYNGDGLFNITDWRDDARVSPAAGRDVADDMLDPSDLIYTFADGVDDDGNGFVDDIAGWDFFGRDNDPFHEYYDGFGTHGTGVAEEAAAEGNDSHGDIGVCPNCAILPVRIGDTFVTDGNRSAEGIAYAVDMGAVAVSQAVGALSNPELTTAAAAYAFDMGVTIIGATGDENAYHHNFPAVLDNILYVHSIKSETGDEYGPNHTYMTTWNCNNYGPRVVMVAPSSACATGAVANLTGAVGLLHAAARDRDIALSAGEVYQLLTRHTDDIAFSAADLDAVSPYPSHEGWDPYTGYGRVNLSRAVEALAAGEIPPWTSVDSPAWFSVHDPAQTSTLDIVGRVSAERSASFTYTVELGLGFDPSDWSEVGSGSGSGAFEGTLATLDLTQIPTAPMAEPTPNETIVERLARVDAPAATVKVTVTDAEGRSGEMRKTFYVHRDPDLKPRFPYTLSGSGESSPILADLDDDGVYELIIANASGEVLALDGQGELLPGWPVLADLHPTAHPEQAAFAQGLLPENRENFIATVAVGDLDGDGAPEVVAASLQGGVYAWQADGSPVDGFPVRAIGRAPEEFDTDHTYDQGFVGSPVLEDLDGDGSLEVIALGMDSRLYAWTAQGEPWGPYPLEICHPTLCGTKGFRAITSPAIGDADGDGDLDIAFGTNEAATGGRYSVTYLIDATTGVDLPGWPSQDLGLINTAVLLPLIGEGHPASVSMCDLDGDGDLELSNPIMLGTTDVVDHENAVALDIGYYGEDFGPDTNALNVPAMAQFVSQPAFGDLDGDGTPDLVMGGVSTLYLASLALTKMYDFQNPVMAWNGADGLAFPAWPRQIEDAQFLMSPAIADVSGDGRPEVIYGSAGGVLHAWDVDGVEAPGWPKFTGNWLLGSPAVGDVDGDGYLDVAVSSREGFVYVWGTQGRADQALSWASLRHDPRNTGTCTTPLATQAGPDALADDGGFYGGCACATPTGLAPLSTLLLPGLGLLLTLRRRRAG
jgi:hypothetical protein